MTFLICGSWRRWWQRMNHANLKQKFEQKWSMNIVGLGVGIMDDRNGDTIWRLYIQNSPAADAASAADGDDVAVVA